MAPIRNVKRMIESQADFAGVEIDRIESLGPGDAGPDNAYRVIINDADTERNQEGFQITYPDGAGADRIFKDNLKQYFEAAKEQLLDTDDDDSESDDDVSSDTDTDTDTDIDTNTNSDTNVETDDGDTEAHMATNTDSSGTVSSSEEKQKQMGYTDVSSVDVTPFDLTLNVEPSDDIEQLADELHEMTAETYATREEYESQQDRIDGVIERLERIENMFDAFETFMQMSMDVDTDTDSESTDTDEQE